MQVLRIQFDGGRNLATPLLDEQAGPLLVRHWRAVRGDSGPPWPPVQVAGYAGVVEIALFQDGEDITASC